MHYHCLSTCSLLDFLLKVCTIVRLQGEKYPFFYFNIVFFITDLCCLCVGVFCKLPLDQYLYAGYRSTGIEIA